MRTLPSSYIAMRQFLSLFAYFNELTRTFGPSTARVLKSDLQYPAKFQIFSRLTRFRCYRRSSHSTHPNVPVDKARCDMFIVRCKLYADKLVCVIDPLRPRPRQKSATGNVESIQMLPIKSRPYLISLVDIDALLVECTKGHSIRRKSEGVWCVAVRKSRDSNDTLQTLQKG